MLRWGEVAAAPHREVLDWYRSLIALRARHESLAPVLLPARHEVRVRDHVVAVQRGSLTVLANLGSSAVRDAPRPAGDVVLSRLGPRAHGDVVDLEPGGVVVVDRS